MDFLDKPINIIKMFSDQDCSEQKYTGGWVEDWKDVTSFPKCGLNLKYPEFDQIVWKKNFQTNSELVEINIRDVLDRFHNDGYKLNSWKYYNIRKELADNSKEFPFFYPEVNLGQDGKYHLGQGRHRLNVLFNIYGVTHIKAERFREEDFI
jgi:hypothetical protein